ncbi:hypothetical protein BK398_27480 [Escherichia coli]|nr:hypothetical protein BK398_27480 [Escherichia coli]
MGEPQMREIARLIHRTLSNTTIALTSKGEKSRANFVLDADIAAEVKSDVAALLTDYPVYPELDLNLLRQAVPRN